MNEMFNIFQYASFETHVQHTIICNIYIWYFCIVLLYTQDMVNSFFALFLYIILKNKNKSTPKKYNVQEYDVLCATFYRV